MGWVIAIVVITFALGTGITGVLYPFLYGLFIACIIVVPIWILSSLFGKILNGLFGRPRKRAISARRFKVIIRPNPTIRLIYCTFAVVFCMVAPLAGCDTAISALERPDSIVVYSVGSTAEYDVVDDGFWSEYQRFKNAKLSDILETAVDPDMVALQKQSDCVELAYDTLQHLEQPNGSTREYDKILFCLDGPLAGEVVLGLDGDYLSGTYKFS